LNRGTKANDTTIIEEDCLLMAYVHVAHDCVLKRGVILANNVNLAGHIEIGEYAVLGGLTAVHQFVKIGAHSMVGGGSLVRKDVPPFIKAAREPLAYVGINSVGLSRHQFSKKQIHHIQDIYRLLFVKGLNVTQAMEAISKELPSSQEQELLFDFISQRSDRPECSGLSEVRFMTLTSCSHLTTVDDLTAIYSFSPLLIEYLLTSKINSISLNEYNSRKYRQTLFV